MEVTFSDIDQHVCIGKLFAKFASCSNFTKAFFGDQFVILFLKTIDILKKKKKEKKRKRKKKKKKEEKRREKKRKRRKKEMKRSKRKTN